MNKYYVYKNGMCLRIKKNVIVFFLVLMFHQPHLAKANILPLQSENPIANFVLNEDDTTRYTHHYLYEQYLREHNMKVLTVEDAYHGQTSVEEIQTIRPKDRKLPYKTFTDK